MLTKDWRRKIRVFARHALIPLFLIAAISEGCSSEPDRSSANGDDPGATIMDIRIGRTTQINRISYSLTGPNGFSAQGSIDVRPLREIEGSIPKGSGETATGEAMRGPSF